MFLTADSLVVGYGIDEAIAKFYVDREPPKDNLYWKDKLLYLRPQMGYVFLPLIADLFFKSGISKDVLLGEAFVQVLEKIGHYSAEQEVGLINTDEALQKSIDLVKPITQDKAFLQNLTEYFGGERNWISSLATPYNALHRGDLFLFSLCTLSLSDEQQKRLVKTWFALISTILLLDDAEDFERDKQTDEENAFLQTGNTKEGFEALKLVIENNLSHLSALNKTLANALRKKFVSLTEKPFIKALNI